MKEDLCMPEMTLKQKICQMLLPAFRYWEPGSSDAMSVGTMAQKLGERQFGGIVVFDRNIADPRSEEHTSELQSRT